jgi:hypothetical protein
MGAIPVRKRVFKSVRGSIGSFFGLSYWKKSEEIFGNKGDRPQGSFPKSVTEAEVESVRVFKKSNQTEPNRKELEPIRSELT